MSTGKEILNEVHANSKQRKKEAKLAVKPWYINMLIWLADALSIVVILAFAVIGIRSLIKDMINPEYALAIAVIIVGALAFRTVEKLYRHRS